MVKRYEHQNRCGDEYDCRMYECSTGDYVAFVDYEEAIISHEKLVDALKKYGDHEPGCIKGDACNCGFEQALEAEE